MKQLNSERSRERKAVRRVQRKEGGKERIRKG